MKVKLTDGQGNTLGEFDAEITETDSKINGSNKSDGNVWIEVDGAMVGSLWLHWSAAHNQAVIDLGGYDDGGEWQEADRISTQPVDEDGVTALSVYE